LSINALSNAALARRPDFEPADTVPATLSEIAAVAAGTPPRPVRTPQDVAAAPVPSPAPATPTGTALQTLTTYLPTEILTLYVAAVAAIGPWTVDGQPVGRWAPFFTFLVATPILVWVAFATKLRAVGKPLPASPHLWPFWEMFAATLAYVAWTFALANTPFAQFTNWYSSGLASFLVLIVSSGLGIVAPLMQRPLAA
jgi:hypothetical protein